MFNKSKVWSILIMISGLILFAFASTIQTACSKSSVQDLTWRLELMQAEQSSDQAMLYLIDGIFEWEEKVGDFSMHGEWTARKARADNRLAKLSVSIPDFQNQLDECNQKGD